jgi:biopolymer transport protein ExbD
MERIRGFLREDLKLDLSEAKTKITNAKEENAEFLSVRIKRSGHTTYTNLGGFSRKNVKNMRLTAPIDKITKKLTNAGFLKEGTPNPKFK